MDKKEVKSEEKKVRFELQEVPTQTTVMIKDNDIEGNYLDVVTALCYVMNHLDKIEKNLIA